MTPFEKIVQDAVARAIAREQDGISLSDYAKELEERWYDLISDGYQYMPEMLRQLRLANENGAGG